MAIQFCFVVFLVFFVDISQAAETSPCGDWLSYKDNRCYKILDNTSLHTYDEAENLCTKAGSTLLQILQKEEQDFITNYIFTVNKVVDNVWIGAKYIKDSYRWILNAGGDEKLAFTNWQQGFPANNRTDHCVQLNSEDGFEGKWIDSLCAKKALVVCQKSQLASIAELLFEAKSAIKQLQEAKETKNNPLPIGFIYIQLPHQLAADEIWPAFNWTDVSHTYEGLFFRVTGGQSAEFGTIQAEASPRLTHVQFAESSDKPSGDIVPGTLSNRITSGASGSGSVAMQFLVSSSEVRPRNTAIKVWKRSS